MVGGEASQNTPASPKDGLGRCSRRNVTGVVSRLLVDFPYLNQSTLSADHMAGITLRTLFQWMPFLFGIGFIAPLTAQLMAYWQIEAPFGLSRIAFGLFFGGAWGLYANIRGRWL